MITKVTSEIDFYSILPNVIEAEIDFLTEKHLTTDFNANNLYMNKKDNQIVGICSLEYSEEFSVTYIKRLLIFKQGKGYAKEFLSYFCSLGIRPLAITPFTENKATISIIKSLGFEYKYTFLKDYLYYEI